MRIPTRAELEKRFRASPLTVQHAINRLRNEGLIDVFGWRGTFVSKYPPHQFHYAMVFHSAPDSRDWIRFYQALASAAAQYNGSPKEPRQLSIHYGVENHADNRAMHNLLSLLHADNLAGIIFPQDPGTTSLAFTPLGTEGMVPRVAFGEAPHDQFNNIQLSPYTEKALDYLAEKKCRNLAVISNLRDSNFRVDLNQKAQERGLTIHPYWFLMIESNASGAVRDIAHLLFNKSQTERPDALFITDDNLTEHAIAGVLNAGIHVPGDLEIVAHCNFPCPVSSIVPVKRVGYDARQILSSCMDLMEHYKKTNILSNKRIDPQFENEL